VYSNDRLLYKFRDANPTRVNEMISDAFQHLDVIESKMRELSDSNGLFPPDSFPRLAEECHYADLISLKSVWVGNINFLIRAGVLKDDYCLDDDFISLLYSFER
jgi:hypothetical protein